MTDLEDIDLGGLKKAIDTLREALQKNSPSELERDGIIQRFEYTFELAWKMIRKVLITMGRSDVSASPRPIIRDAKEEGLIGDVEKWFFFLEARNPSTHIYNQKEAQSVHKAAKEFLPFAEKLLTKLEGTK